MGSGTLESHLAFAGDQLWRIATALETLAADVTVRREAERASAVSQLEQLEDVFRAARQNFAAADRAASRAGAENRPWRGRDEEWHYRAELALQEAETALATFRAAHPELEDAQ